MTPPAAAGRPAMSGTSDLSIDETLLLDSIGWEPVDLVIGASVAAAPPTTFSRGFASTDEASAVFGSAVASAVTRLQVDCERAGGAGVVGVNVDIEVRSNVFHAVLVGTAVRPGDGAGEAGGARRRGVWVSDLSTRDFCLLHGAGWEPLGLAFGTAFVQVPYRSAATVLKQVGANVELTNLTEALYAARERGMERMQSSALAMGASGVVAVQIIDRPLPHASHVMGFSAWGTAVRLVGDSHRYLRPQMVVSLDDSVVTFDVGRAMDSRR